MAKKSKSNLTTPTLDYEVGVGFPAVNILGVDEVGRGCLAGPVVAAAVCLPQDWSMPISDLFQKQPILSKVNDSKLLSSKMREQVSDFLKKNLRYYSISECSPQEIDEINIFQASLKAMAHAVNETIQKSQVDASCFHLLVDGSHAPSGVPCSSTSIVKGDQKSLSIACASILAKVYRDDLMKKMEAQYPGYGFAVHKGYATSMHRSALKLQGPCVIHRKSFSPIKEMVQFI